MHHYEQEAKNSAVFLFPAPFHLSRYETVHELKTEAAVPITGGWPRRLNPKQKYSYAKSREVTVKMNLKGLGQRLGRVVKKSSLILD